MAKSANRPETRHAGLVGVDQLEQIDEICLRFDRSWSDGHPLSIESLLEGSSGVFRRRLLEELLRVEIEYRLRLQGSVAREDYRSRFSSDLSIVDVVLDESLRNRDTADTEVHWGVGIKTDSLNTSAPQQPLDLPCRIDCYELLEVLGEGGMGIVYRAREYAGGQVLREVALKLIRPDRLAAYGQGEDVRRRFVAEASSAAKVHHENIVPLYAYGELASQPYLSMRLMTGGSLEQALRQGPFPARRAAELLLQTASAVATLHQQSIIHRDIKPRNILFDDKERAHLTDFGLARWEEAPQDLTHTGCLVGTPAYMPPEQADGRSVDPRTDVYSLGATLYESLTGRPPFQAASLSETLRQVAENDPIPPRQLNASIPRDLETVCLKCLEKKPANRYASAEEFADELRRFSRGEPIRARPLSLVGRLAKWSRRRPWAALALSLLILIAVTGPPVALFQARLADRNAALSDSLASKNQDLVDTNLDLTDALATIREQQTTLRRSLLNSDLPRIQDAVKVGNTRSARRHLARHIPRGDEMELRSFGWHWLWGQTHQELVSKSISVSTSATGSDQIASQSSDGKLLALISDGSQPYVVDLEASRLIEPPAASLVRQDVVNPQLKRSIPCQVVQFVSPNQFVTASHQVIAVTTSPQEQLSWVDVVAWKVETREDGRELVATRRVTLDSRRLKQLRGGGANLKSTPRNAIGTSAIRSSCVGSIIAISPDGKWLATVADQGSIARPAHALVLWDARTGQPASSIPIQASRDACLTGRLAFSPAGRLIVLADKLGTLHFWDIGEQQFKPLPRMNEPEEGDYHGGPQISSLHFGSGEDELLCAGATDGSVWEFLPHYSKKRLLKAPDGVAVSSMTHLEDGILAWIPTGPGGPKRIQPAVGCWAGGPP